MNNREMLPILKEIQQQNMSRFGEIFSEFERLLARFRFRLNDDDASQELTLFFLELLTSMDTDKFMEDESEGLKRYIAVCLRNHYIALSKRQSAYRMMCDELYEGLASDMLSEEKIELKHALRRLPDKQRLVIVYRYLYGYSIEEIAALLSVTRQAANQLKKRGLKSLKTYFTG